MYSLSLLSAISKESLLANQLIEGGVDATIFENFLYRLLVHVRERPEFAGRQVVLLMDNASIHHHRRVCGPGAEDEGHPALQSTVLPVAEPGREAVQVPQGSSP